MFAAEDFTRPVADYLAHLCGAAVLQHGIIGKHHLAMAVQHQNHVGNVLQQLAEHQFTEEGRLPCQAFRGGADGGRVEGFQSGSKPGSAHGNSLRFS
jgi:hypothetical protein